MFVNTVSGSVNTIQPEYTRGYCFSFVYPFILVWELCTCVLVLTFKVNKMVCQWLFSHLFTTTIIKSDYEQRMECNSVKFETGWNLPLVLKIVTHTAHAVYT